MGSTIAAIVTVVGLSGWHLRTRRHPNWSVNSDARFYITLGYPAVAIAVFWLVESPAATTWEWALGNLWAFGAMTSFVYGFNALHTQASAMRSATRDRLLTTAKRGPDATVER